jgi:hypothetical protein
MRLTGYSAPQTRDSNKTSDTRPVARSTVRSTKDSSALKLTLKTAEGDTVEISLEAQSVRQGERSSARGPQGRIAQKSDSRSNSLTASVNVTGDLSDAELEDIKGLLQSLAGGDTPQAGEGDLDTISAYQYSYQRRHEVTRAQAQVYG